MLDQFRKYQDNFIFSFLILAIVAVMGLYGVNQLSEDKPGVGAAAWVNGEPITNDEYQQVLGAQIRMIRAKVGSQADEKFIAQFQIPQRALDELVQYKLVAQQADRNGFRVSDKELAASIRKAPDFQREGKFDPDLYREIPNRGLLEKRVREEKLVERFQTYLAGRLDMPPDMLAREHELKDTKVNLTLGRVDFKSLAGKQNPSSGDVDAFLKATPAEPIKAYYDSHQKDFSTPAAVQLRQIRVGLPFQASAEKKASAKKKIEEVAKQTNPDNFAAMAEKHSDDEHAKKGGLVGWVNRGTLEPTLEQAIDKLQPGEVSPPIETSYGYYLVQVKDSRPEKVKPLEDVKREIAKTLLIEKRTDDFIKNKKSEWEKKLAAGQSIENELKAANVELKKTGPFSLGQGYIPQVGQVDEITDAVFKLTKAKPIAPKLYPNGNDFYFVKLESVEAPRKSDFEANYEAAAASLEQQLQNAFMTKWVEDVKEASAVRIDVKFDGA